MVTYVEVDQNLIQMPSACAQVIGVNFNRQSIQQQRPYRKPLEEMAPFAGVFVSTRSLFGKNSSSHADCNDSDRTLDTTSSSTTATTTTTATPTSTCWNSPGSIDHMSNSPLIVLSNADLHETIHNYQVSSRKDDIMTHSKRLPGTWYYSSNHVMINQERIKRGVAPLIRMKELDELARQHAQVMAEKATLFHMNPDNVMACLADRRPMLRRLGLNIARGRTIRDIHSNMMTGRKQQSHKNNMIDARFTLMGMGTARIGMNGELFLCQIFCA